MKYSKRMFYAKPRFNQKFTGAQRIKPFYLTAPLCAFMIIILLVTCKSIPVMPDSFLKNERFLPLETGASVYLVANVVTARCILDLLPIEELKDNQAKDLLDRTGYAVAALFPEESGKRFQLCAWGNYPSFRAGFAFTFDKNWKKQRSSSGDSYWHSAQSGLSIALTSEQAFAASSLNRTPADPLSGQAGKEIPEGFNDFRAGSPVSFWLEEPDKVISRLFDAAGIPIQFPVKHLFVNIIPIENNYEADICFLLENTSQTRGMAAILNLASRHMAGDSDSIIAMLFFANPSVQKDRSLNLKSAVLDENNIRMLFNIFFRI
ncbi:MAG: hypothetical protein LBG94_03265 [Treponema sp.]|jgi:hypothetical protein|nr:hypothetical protein [Treponema sp.]